MPAIGVSTYKHTGKQSRAWAASIKTQFLLNGYLMLESVLFYKEIV